MTFTYIDIGIVAILLIAFFVGVKRGFVDSILGLIGGIVSLVIAILLADTVVALIGDFLGIKSSIQTWATGFLTDSVFKGNTLFTQPMDPENVSSIVAQALEQLKLPEMISAPLAGSLESLVNGVLANTEIANASLVNILAPVITRVIMLIIAVILTFIVIRIIVAIIEAIAKAILKTSKALRGLDRFFGGIVGLVKGALAVLIIFTLGTFVLSGTDPNGTDIKAQIVQTIDDSTIGKYVYHNNILTKLITDNINWESIEQLITGQPAATPAPTAAPSSTPTAEPTPTPEP